MRLHPKPNAARQRDNEHTRNNGRENLAFTSCWKRVQIGRLRRIRRGCNRLRRKVLGDDFVGGSRSISAARGTMNWLRQLSISGVGIESVLLSATALDFYRNHRRIVRLELRPARLHYEFWIASSQSCKSVCRFGHMRIIRIMRIGTRSSIRCKPKYVVCQCVNASGTCPKFVPLPGCLCDWQRHELRVLGWHNPAHSTFWVADLNLNRNRS
jgi:hypothetical protein